MDSGVFADTYVLLRCHNAFILPILDHCSSVWGSAAYWYLEFLHHQVRAVATLFPDAESRVHLNRRRCVDKLRTLHCVLNRSSAC